MDSIVQVKLIWIFVVACCMAALLGTAFAFILQERKKNSRLQLHLQERTADLELQITKAKAATAAKSDFLSRMSHEIRTPLNAIIGMSQIAQNSSRQEKIADCMQKVEKSSKHLLGIINDILDFSKLESASLVLEEAPFSLRQDIGFIEAMFKDKVAEKGLNFQVTLDHIQHDGIVADVLRLNQVLINLLSNAIKFTDSGGSIRLTVEEQAHFQGESIYRFAIRDTGIGIAPEQAKKLFTPFSQANASVARLYGGTGLGLSISQNIVKMMGGEIELETAPGEGSEFRFTIRVLAEKAVLESTARPRRASHGKLRGKRILIVDDLEINREVAAALLDGSGTLIETAANGKEALDAFCASQPFWYDMILMDMQMPVMDGCAATEEIRTSGRPDAREVKILAMTANVLPEDVERVYQSGMNGHLAKPLEMDVLYETMEEWL